MKNILLSLLYFLSFILSTTSWALPPEFSATYMLKSYGINVAIATYDLKQVENGVKFSQSAKTIGFASWFKNETIDESSRLSVRNDLLLLDKYSYVQSNGEDDGDVRLKINWVMNEQNQLSGNITGSAYRKKINKTINAPVWDTLSIQIPVMENPQNKIKQWESSIIVKGEVRQYTFITHPEEEIVVSGNKLKTIKIERESDSDKPLFYWLAPELNYLPVKIEKWKKGKPNLTMLLTNASFNQDKNKKFKSKEIFED